METFAREPGLAKLLRELKFTLICTIKKSIVGDEVGALVVHQKKERWIFSHVCNGKLAVFWALCYTEYFLTTISVRFPLI